MVSGSSHGQIETHLYIICVLSDEEYAKMKYYDGMSQSTGVGFIRYMCLYEEESWRICGCMIDLFIQPIICLLGIVLNCACLLVFSSHRSHSLVPALIVLSLSDFLQLLFSLFVLFIPALHDFTGSPQFGALVFCYKNFIKGQIAYLSTGLLSPLLLAFNCASIWTICYISIQRHQAILRPLSSMYSPPRPFAPLLAITIAALLFNGSKWAEFHWGWVKVDNSTSWFLLHEPSSLANSETYRRVFNHFLYPVTVYLIPLLLLSVLNFRILSNISIHRVSFNHKSRLAQESRSVTLLISIVILFFLCHTGGLAIRFVDQSKYADSELFVFLKDVINLLFNVNSFANPMLYFFFTRQFRDLRVSFLHSHFASPSRSGSLAVNVIRDLSNKFVSVLYPIFLTIDMAFKWLNIPRITRSLFSTDYDSRILFYCECLPMIYECSENNLVLEDRRANFNIREDRRKMKPFDNIYLNMLAQSNLEYGGISLEELTKLETNRKIVDRPSTLERNRVEDDPQLDKKEMDRKETESSTDVITAEISRGENITSVHSSQALESRKATTGSEHAVEKVKIPPSPFRTIRRKEARRHIPSESDESTSENINPFEDIATRSPPRSAAMKTRVRSRRRKTKAEDEELSLRRPSNNSQERFEVGKSDLVEDEEESHESVRHRHQRRPQKSPTDESIETDLRTTIPPPTLVPYDEVRIHRLPDNPFKHYDITRPTVINLPLPPNSDQEFEK
uniref:G_PROTEIN_RECEP_F1_2 domain-containing protein n=1 Tax=Heterorhabditis bacteriophora TaxID=37862 RepID=A0A1I7XRU2_HETBA